MKAECNFLLELLATAKKYHIRFGVVLKGEKTWQLDLISCYLSLKSDTAIVQLGGVPLTRQCPNLLLDNFTSLSFKKGQQLLGRECAHLVCDFTPQDNEIKNGIEFDANSFSAALGSITGGGLLFIIDCENRLNTPDNIWLNNAFEQLYVIKQNQALPVIDTNTLPSIPNSTIIYHQQQHTISLVEKLLSGRRKRPLVITADRGRGKSSALGMASANLMTRDKAVNIIVTAPSIKAVEPIFSYVLKGVDDILSSSKYHIELASGSRIQFISPDELLRSLPDADLLLVDEAAAIPLPMLTSMLEVYHRMVFSTTIHGYEGCGRGFSIKFQAWLNAHRPGWKGYHLNQPIRWQENDPLELWLFKSFLLDSSIESFEPSNLIIPSASPLIKLDKKNLLTNAKLLSQCFALLVHAHYQTTPNDLFQLLKDDNSDLFAWIVDGKCLTCVLVVSEGNLKTDLIEQVQLGLRRPKGHMIPLSIANHLAVSQAATQRCCRIMRIAVSPNMQGLGVGSAVLNWLEESLENKYDYIGSSFAATAELVSFWRNNGYQSIRLGSTRDQASGCHSLVVCKSLQVASKHWIFDGHRQFRKQFTFLLSSTFSDLDLVLIKGLLTTPLLVSQPDVLNIHRRLLDLYGRGGSGANSVSYVIYSALSELSNLDGVDDLLLKYFLLQHSPSVCIEYFKMAGRKEFESELRKSTLRLLSRFTV
ncbi:hypothetical protein BCU68_03695 [Vibrio sp. 10N.286.49.B3]|uniref:GNAT family N-acetyltransferase n=1 Tax=Vibrio sp. 10N.286.49.B3 TaxID=1880855 RepID=UPI000C855338|nr:GNAT family N-acetyltransferase [Vibrio sp. 10N.286.49.B3]PMH43104.1 hypothetical protein BCU68_03695 [Vibrio sp. 10N.286.49.B3]